MFIVMNIYRPPQKWDPIRRAGVLDRPREKALIAELSAMNARM